MVKISDLKIGDKVKVVDQWNNKCVQAVGGAMDMWLGQVLTVSKIMTDIDRIKFDECPTWVWNEHMLDKIIEDDYDCDIDDMGDINALFDFE